MSEQQSGKRQPPPRALVIGRRILDFERAGAAPPGDWTVLACAGCKQSVALSPDGIKRIQSLQGAAVCQYCALLATEIRPDFDVGMTPYGASQIEHSQVAKDLLSVFLARADAGKPRPAPPPPSPPEPGLTCDTCGATPGELWVFKHGAATFMYVDRNGKTNRVDMSGAWGACDACAQMILREDLAGLVERSNPGPDTAATMFMLHKKLLEVVDRHSVQRITRADMRR